MPEPALALETKAAQFGEVEDHRIPFQAEVCPLVLDAELDRCAQLQATDCAEDESQLCWPRVWTGKEGVVLCDCFDDLFGQCGALDVSKPPYLQCFAMAYCPNGRDSCQIQIDGTGTGHSRVLESQVPRDSVVTCGCAAQVPAASQWSVTVMTLLLFTAGTVMVARRRRPAGFNRHQRPDKNAPQTRATP